MLNRTKIVSEKLKVTPRHARRLIAEGDYRAQEIIDALPTTTEDEFNWRLQKMVLPVVQLGLVSQELWEQHIAFWTFILDHSEDKEQVEIPDDVANALQKMQKAVLALKPRSRIYPIWQAFEELARLLQLASPWSNPAHREPARGRRKSRASTGQ